jgi:hypothetical protein
MNMVDQCKHCTLCGDIEGCKAIECSQHESWYAKHMISENAQLKARVAELKECNANLQSLQGMKELSLNAIGADFITEAAACAESFQIDDTLAITYESLIEYAERLRGIKS